MHVHYLHSLDIALIACYALRTGGKPITHSPLVHHSLEFFTSADDSIRRAVSAALYFSSIINIRDAIPSHQSSCPGVLLIGAPRYACKALSPVYLFDSTFSRDFDRVLKILSQCYVINYFCYNFHTDRFRGLAVKNNKHIYFAFILKVRSKVLCKDVLAQR